MAEDPNKKMPKGGGGGNILLTPATYEAMRTAAERPVVVMDPKYFDSIEKGGRIFYTPKDRSREDSRAGGGGGRFVPSIGGTDGDRLYVSPGTVSYVPMGQENRDDDDDQPQAQQVEPIFPKIEETALNAEDGAYFPVGDRSSAAVWLCAQRLRCGTTLSTEDETERLEIVDRGEKPEEVEGEIHRLLFELDLEDVDGGGKSIANLDQRIASDVDVWYLCEESEVSEEETSEFDSEDLQSSELEDVDPDSGSGSDPDCPWHMEAKWFNRRSCYPKNPSIGSVVIGALVAIDLGPMFRRCRNWFAYISMSGGQPKGSALPAGVEIIGTELRVALTQRRTINIQAPFFFLETPCKTEQTVTVRLSSQQKEGVEEGDEEECCGEAAGSKTVSIGLWPGWCEYGGHCGSTTVLPP